MRKFVIILIAVMFMTQITFAATPELAVHIDNVEKSTAKVRLYSTEKITEGVDYDLYTIEKENGKWIKKAYIRTITLPKANKEREGKYKYCSKVYKVEHLAKGYVYTLAPTQEKAHFSKPFWRKPLI